MGQEGMGGFLREGCKTDRDADFRGVCFLINELLEIETRFISFLNIYLLQTKVDTVEVRCRSWIE